MEALVSAAEFEQFLGDVSEAITAVPMEFQRLVDNVTSWVDWIPGAAEAVADALSWIGEKIAELVIVIEEWLTYPGVPWTLWTHGDTWTEEVGGKASEWAGVFTPGHLLTDDEWTGTAATSYANTLQPQHDALVAITDFTDSSHKDGKGETPGWEMSKA